VAEADWNGVLFNIVDTGGIDPSWTGGSSNQQPLSVGSADFIDEIRHQAEIAIQDADAVLLVLDVMSGVTPADQEVVNILRRRQKSHDGKPWPPVLLVVNKVDSQQREMLVTEFYELGMGEPYPISAQHGLGTGDLLDALVAVLPASGEAAEDESIKISIVGKPNVGKSSLLNKLLGEERAIVSAIPGTTRDAVDSFMEYEGIPITLIDTAGIRRRGRVEPGVEKFSVLRSLRAIERSDVALLLIDATTGITAQDTHIAGLILDAWKSVVVLINKWDLVEKDTHTMDLFTHQIRKELNFMDYVPLLFISAKTGQRVDRVLPLALRVQEERLIRLPTSQLNKIFHEAQDHRPAPSLAGRQLKFYYSTQVRSDPPTFLLYVNDPQLTHFTYQRYLENQLRTLYPFIGTPIRLVMRPRR